MSQRHKTILFIGFILLVINLSFAMYDTNTGRFMQQDPLEYVDSMNMYEYVNSQPMHNTDPTGHFTCPDCITPDPEVKESRHHRGWSTGRVDATWLLRVKIDKEDSCYNLKIKKAGCRIKEWYYDPPTQDMIYPSGLTPKEHEDTHVRLTKDGWATLKDSLEGFDGLSHSNFGVVNCYKHVIKNTFEYAWTQQVAANLDFDCAEYPSKTKQDRINKDRICNKANEYRNKLGELQAEYFSLMGAFRGFPHPCATVKPETGEINYKKTTENL